MSESSERQEQALSQWQERYKKRLKKKQVVHRGDAFDEAFFFDYLSSEHVERIHQVLTEKRFAPNRSDVGTRVINHWESEGIIEDPRSDGTGWRRFSILDIVWLHAVARLRSFGMSIDKLKRTRRSLESLGAGSTKEGSRITFYEFYLRLALLREPVFLIVFEDGEVELATEQEYSAGLTRLLGGLADHVRINLNSILQRLFPKLDLRPQRSTTAALTDEETKVLFLLRTGNYDSLEIKRRDGRIERIEATEEVDAAAKIEQLLSEHDFQEITVKEHEGRVARITRTIKTQP